MKKKRSILLTVLFEERGQARKKGVKPGKLNLQLNEQLNNCKPEDHQGHISTFNI